jgi:uncharacterized RDD family membrane protein YckC
MAKRHAPALQRGREVKSDTRYAGVWIRFLAIVLDVLILSAVFFPVTRMVKGTWLMTPADHQWVYGWFITDPLCIAFLVVMFLYFLLLEGVFGATAGKWVLGLRVTRTDGTTPGVLKSLVRNLLRAIDGLPAVGILGAVLIALSRERTRLGDLAAGTRVVHTRRGAD